MAWNKEISKLERELDKDPDNGNLHYKIALMLNDDLPAIAIGHLSLAANSKKRSSGVDKGSIYALMGEIYSRQENLLAAAKYYVMAHQESPSIYGTKILVSAATLFSRVNDYDQAISAARRAVEIKPKELSAWNTLVESYIKKENNVLATLSTLEMSYNNLDSEEARILFQVLMGKIPRLKTFREAMRELPNRL